MLTPDLSGRTALVTGSARGLGRALALAFADCGAAVAVHYHTSGDAAEAVAETARERGAPAATTVQGDVTDPDAVDRLFDAVEDDLGAPDVLVNNVGAFAPDHWTELDFEDVQRVVETNFYGTYLCTRRALPAMRNCGADTAEETADGPGGPGGRIVNVGYASSEKGLVNPKNFPYFAAKAGVLMFTRMVAADTQDDGVTCNAVSPYVIENSDEFPEALPRGRAASFEDVANAVLFFCHPDTGYVSGENVEVDGGWLPEDV